MIHAVQDSVAGSESHCTFGPVEVSFDGRVLTPRPWTLLQSEWAAELARDSPSGPLLELCAGAGHIGLAAAALSGRKIVQVEADSVAAAYARRNAVAAHMGDRVDVRSAPMQSALAPDERFPLVLGDPPYLPTGEVSRWPEDPVRAIDGGDDGLDLVRVCLDVASHHLSDGGALLLQVAGAAQADVIGLNLLPQMAGPWRHSATRGHDAERAVMLIEPGV